MDTTRADLDLIQALVLQRAKQRLTEEGLVEVSGIGPVDINFESKIANCEIHLRNSNNTLPTREAIYTGNETLQIVYRRSNIEPRPATMFASGAKAISFPGRLRGGDACQNVAYRQFGTIALTGNIRLEGVTYQEVALSCQHVMYNSTTSAIESPRFGTCMNLYWAPSVPSQGKWTDVAVATINNSSIHSPRRLRALGLITGVRQPRAGMRVMKYGANSGLTVGRDKGLVWRALDNQNPSALYLVRMVNGGSFVNFSGVGDSGAAVVDADRKLLGIILGGIPSNPIERWYLPVTPEGETPVDRDLSTFTLALF